MTQFQPGSPDDVAWCVIFAAVVAHGNLAPSDEKCAIYADRMMAERAKRLTTPAPAAPADDRPKWRCVTCVHYTCSSIDKTQTLPGWCGKHRFGHAIPDFGCPQWEGKEEA